MPVYGIAVPSTCGNPRPANTLRLHLPPLASRAGQTEKAIAPCKAGARLKADTPSHHVVRILLGPIRKLGG